jgi:ankyrin repeat protein
MDYIPKKEPKRDKWSFQLWHSKEAPPSYSDKKELSVSEEKQPKRMIHSAPVSPISNIDSTKKTPAKSEQPGINPKNPMPLISLTELLDTDNERNARSEVKRSKHTLSRSLSPSPTAKDQKKITPEQLSSSDPGKSLFRRSRDKSAIKPTKRTVSPQRSPKKSEIPTTFESALQATHHEEVNLVKEFIDNPKNNPNAVDKNGNSLVHHATLTSMAKNNLSLITAFIFNPRVNFLLKNKDGYAPIQFVAENDIRKHQKLYDLLQQQEWPARISYAILVIKLIARQCDNAAIKKAVKKIYKKIPKEKIPAYVDIPFLCTMIQTRLHDDKPMIQIMHDQYKDNPSCKDEWGNTAFHHIAYLRDEKMLVKTLVKHPNSRCDEPNNAGFVPQALLDSLHDEPMRAIFFTSTSLKRWIKDAVDTAPLKYPMIKNFHISKTCDEGFLAIKNSILELAKEIEGNQIGSSSDDNDRALPQKSAQLPDYANDEFLLAAILAYMKTSTTTPVQALECFQYFNPNPVFTESSESEKPKKEPAECNSGSLERQLAEVEKKIMDEIDSGKIKPISSDSNLIKTNTVPSTASARRRTVSS